MDEPRKLMELTVLFRPSGDRHFNKQNPAVYRLVFRPRLHDLVIERKAQDCLGFTTWEILDSDSSRYTQLVRMALLKQLGIPQGPDDVKSYQHYCLAEEG